jgi:protein-S-isoprenylcysteine O-methyltransferase Ste14
MNVGRGCGLHNGYLWHDPVEGSRCFACGDDPMAADIRKRSKRVGREEQMRGDFIQRGGLWVMGQGALLCAVIAGGPIWRGQWQSLASILCGVLLLLVSAACGIAGTFSLGRNLTPFPKPTRRARLVRTGIYGLIRHPLYTAVFCGSASWALLWGSWLALVAALALAPLFDAKARREERWLRERFPEYSAYEQRVRRFIPWVY